MKRLGKLARLRRLATDFDVVLSTRFDPNADADVRYIVERERIRGDGHYGVGSGKTLRAAISEAERYMRNDIVDDNDDLRERIERAEEQREVMRGERDRARRELHEVREAHQREQRRTG